MPQTGEGGLNEGLLEIVSLNIGPAEAGADAAQGTEEATRPRPHPVRLACSPTQLLELRNSRENNRLRRLLNLSAEEHLINDGVHLA